VDIPHPNPVGDNDLSRFDVVHKLTVVPTTYNTSPDPCSGGKKSNRDKPRKRSSQEGALNNSGTVPLIFCSKFMVQDCLLMQNCSWLEVEQKSYVAFW